MPEGRGIEGGRRRGERGEGGREGEGERGMSLNRQNVSCI